MAIITIDEDYDDSTKLGDYYPKIKNNLRTITDTINGNIAYENVDGDIKSALDSMSAGGEWVFADDSVTTSKIADKAVTAEKLADGVMVVFGTYTGDGEASQTIDLGFTPVAVEVWTVDGRQGSYDNAASQYSGGLAFTGHPCQSSAGTVFKVCEDGFTVYRNSDKYTYTNENNWVYYYKAYRYGTINE